VTLWVFSVFPGLRPWEPPVVRKVTISDVAIAEPRLGGGDMNPVSVVLVDVTVQGYVGDYLEVWTLWLDERNDDRISTRAGPSGPTYHGRLKVDTATDTVALWLHAEPPTPEEMLGMSGCYFVRVVLMVAPDERGFPLLTAATPTPTALVRADPLASRTLVAHADSPAFDPFRKERPKVPNAGAPGRPDPPDACDGLAAELATPGESP
jgi:hypothetical protein